MAGFSVTISNPANNYPMPGAGDEYKITGTVGPTDVGTVSVVVLILDEAADDALIERIGAVVDTKKNTWYATYNYKLLKSPYYYSVAAIAKLMADGDVKESAAALSAHCLYKQ